MIKIHPKILEKNGKKEFAIIPYEEFKKIEDELDDYKSLKILRAAKNKEVTAKTISLDKAKEMLNIVRKKSK